MGSVAPEFLFHPEERVAVFIDGANLYQAARGIGFDIDYKRLLRAFSYDCRLIRAYYYTALLDSQEYSPVRPLVDWRDSTGYTMVTKPLREFTEATGRRKYKGNMDVEIAVDVMELAANLDHVVLLSGDGDFRRLVESVQRRGVRVTVVSTIRTQPPMVADELRRQADRFIDLVELQPRIARDPAPGAGYRGEEPARGAGGVGAAVTAGSATAVDDDGDDEFEG